jgi:hypothetical protein
VMLKTPSSEVTGTSAERPGAAVRHLLDRQG